MKESLESMAARASSDPFFLGWALAAYQERHGLDDAALALELGCNDVGVLAVLRLCRRPGAAEPDQTAEEDVAVIAERFGIDPAALRQVMEAAAGV